jgi:hypothetical protein
MLKELTDILSRREEIEVTEEVLFLERIDLPSGHWLYGKKAKKNVMSGELDQVQISSSEDKSELVSVSNSRELEEKESEVLALTARPSAQVESK